MPLLKKKLVLQSDFSELERLEAFLKALQQEINFDHALYSRIFLAVSEAVNNSIIHGNKADSAKQITIKTHRSGKHLTFLIEDEGPGFNPDSISDPLADDNLLKTSGRGIFLMKEYADSVEYSKEGTMLTLTFLLESDK